LRFAAGVPGSVRSRRRSDGRRAHRGYVQLRLGEFAQAFSELLAATPAHGVESGAQRGDISRDIALAGRGIQKRQQVFQIPIAEVAVAVGQVTAQRRAHTLFQSRAAGLAGFACAFGYGRRFPIAAKSEA